MNETFSIKNDHLNSLPMLLPRATKKADIIASKMISKALFYFFYIELPFRND